MNRFFIQEGLHKWLIMDRETGRTVDRRSAKEAADELAKDLNGETDLTLTGKPIYFEQHEAGN